MINSHTTTYRLNNCNLREIEGNVDVEVDSNGSMINLYGKRKIVCCKGNY